MSVLARLLSYWRACALSWHPDLFVAGWRLGRVHNRLQRGAVGLCEWGHALACVVGWLVGVAVVVELCVSMVGCYRTGWHVLCRGIQFLFVAGWRLGRVRNRLQRGAVGPGEWGHALACVVGWGRCGC